MEKDAPHILLINPWIHDFAAYDFWAKPIGLLIITSIFLNPTLGRRSPRHVVEEIDYWHEKYTVLDFAFYDDALLIDADRHIIPIVIGFALDTQEPFPYIIRTLSTQEKEGSTW